MTGRGLSKLSRSGECAFRHITGAPSRRTFASSAVYQKQGPVPSFTKTSSPELDQLFSTFRNDVFLPAHLSKRQRDVIYKPKYQRMLLSETITLNVADEEFSLKHIDRLKLPNSRKGLLKALDLMQDKRDWDNLPRFLEGLHNAGRQMRNLAPFAVVKKAANAGRLDVVLECARRVSSTGFRLKDAVLVNEIVWRIQEKAMLSGWNAKETKQALTWVEMVSVLLEDERHAGSRAVNGGADPRVQPDLVGILLQLAAVRAAQHLDGKDEDGKVAEYAKRFLGLRQGGLEPTTKTANTPDEVHAANHWLGSMLPILHGMKVAQTVLDPASEVAVELKAKATGLQELVSQQRDMVITSGISSRFRELGVYEKLLS